MLDKYFYIITRDKQIFEVRNIPQKLASTFAAMKDKGLLSLKDEGIVLNGVDISKILTEAQYDNYIYSVKPAEYIKNGTWYDSKEKGVLRHEKWKQEEIDSKKKLEQSNLEERRYISPEHWEKFKKEMREMFT